MLKQALMGAVFGGLLFVAAPSPVQANVVYTFLPLEAYRNASASYEPDIYSGVGFELELKDGAINKGSFNLTARGNGTGPDRVSFTGDIGSFVRFTTFDSQDYVTPDFAYGALSVSLNINHFGDITNGRLQYGGRNTELNLNISQNFVTGTWGADYPNCSGCTEYGFLYRTTDVPEPASMALLGVGLLGMGAIRRRAA